MTWRSESKNPLLRQLQASTPGGHCVFCGVRLTGESMREQYVCLGAACRTAYNTTYRRWKREQHTLVGLTMRGTVPKSKAPRWQAIRNSVVSSWDEADE